MAAKDQAFPMIAAIQKAHYVDGRRVVDVNVLAEVAGSTGLNESEFRKQYAAAPVAEHIKDSQDMMHRFGLHGFPTFLLSVQASSPVYRMNHFMAGLTHSRSYSLRYLRKQGRDEVAVADDTTVVFLVEFEPAFSKTRANRDGRHVLRGDRISGKQSPFPKPSFTLFWEICQSKTRGAPPTWRAAR
ncbi:hypothetical protein QP185_22110 [Sphingomonas aerolata]|uniref:hypothetical protein n=1 Tax=Sphingomonas aerolata TaxID=185951 RepID=UPI002FE229E1